MARPCLLLVLLLLGACRIGPDERPDPRPDWARPPADGTAPDGAAPAEPDEPDAQSDLADLRRWMERHSPALQAAALRWQAAEERAPQARSLPDPRLQFGWFLEEVQTRTGPMQWRAGLSQRLPWPGDRDLAGNVAEARAAALGARFHQLRLDLSAQLDEAWAELAWVGAAHQVTLAHRGLLSHWEEVARTRYATGLADEADLLRAQVELGKLDDRVRSLDDLRRPLRAQLNALLGREPDAPLPPAALGEPPAVVLEDGELAAALEQVSPALLALDHEVVAARHARDLAGSRGRPDTVVGLDYTRIGKGGDDAVALNLGIELPIWRSAVTAAKREGEASLGAALAARRDAGLTLRADVERQLFALRDADRRLSLYRDTLITKGQEAVQSLAVSYQSGTAMFLDVIDAERVLLEFELAAARALADRAQALARLTRLTGVDPTRTPAREEPSP